MLVGYARVSTADQKLDAQLDALRSAGCQAIYSEKLSGATTERAELQRLLLQIRPGETLVITALAASPAQPPICCSWRKRFEIAEHISDL